MFEIFSVNFLSFLMFLRACSMFGMVVGCCGLRPIFMILVVLDSLVTFSRSVFSATGHAEDANLLGNLSCFKVRLSNLIVSNLAPWQKNI